MHRLFVAIRPPGEVRDLLLDLMDGVPDLRWQEEAQLHLTLRFIGEVSSRLADDLANQLQRIRFGQFQVGLSGVGKFERHRHGALWAGVSPKEELRALNAKVERVCQASGLDPEHRAFHPHVTLARWKGRPRGLDAFLDRNGGLTSPFWTVEEFILYESRLGRGGAHYEAIETYALE